MPSLTHPAPVVLSAPTWQARRAAHETRVGAWIDPHQARRSRGEQHPVYDFMFSYYSFRPAWLRRWHPGPDVALEGAEASEYLRWPEYHVSDYGIRLSVAALPAHRHDFVRWLRDLLTTMQSRPAFFGCFGLHEWAMVYRQTADEVRHNVYPLRYPADELERIVDRSALCCTHHDAFRFFTPPAKPLNRFQPAREGVPRNEQRGCLHANMDLYKWAFKLAPFTPSELVADCFELACAIREVDMRASPYDLRALGFDPIRVEEETGRVEYETLQRAFSARGEPLRERLIALCERLLAP